MNNETKLAARALHAITFPESGSHKRITSKVSSIAASVKGLLPKHRDSIHGLLEVLEVAETYYIKAGRIHNKEFDLLTSFLRNVGIDFHTIDVVLRAVSLIHDTPEFMGKGYLTKNKDAYRAKEIELDREFFERHVAKRYEDLLFFKFILGSLSLAELNSVDHGARVKDFYQNAHLELNENWGGTYAAA